MADHLRPSSREEARGEDSSIPQSPSHGEESSTAADRPNLAVETPSSTGPSLNTNAEAPSGHGLRRHETLPGRGNSANRQDGASPDTRRRGRTVSSKPRDLSPRSQLFRRNPSNAGGGRVDDAMGSITEGGRGSTEFRSPRRSNTSAEPRLTSPGLRPRVSTVTGRPRGSTLNRRPSIAVAAITSGRDQDAQSQANFSLAGPSPIDTVAANQPYVDAGYGQLNPAYEQPVNVRPVWGLAKPLPRVIRPGMVPTRSEINLQQAAEPEQPQDSANVDLEQGRIEPTLRVDKISSQLQNTREQRENNLLRTFTRREGRPSGTNLGRAPSSVARPLSPSSQVIQEEDDLGLQPLDSVQEEQTKLGTEEQKPQQHEAWYSDDAITEHEQEGDLDGDFIGHEDIPLPAYDAENDEIHNLHTHWSVIRLRFREPLAELLAVRCSPLFIL
jgi:aquaglyceroporin related protein